MCAKRFSVGEFGAILRTCEIPFDSLYQFYIGKNVLNRFRQDHGYKTGGYVKNWDGREDNEVLSEILKNQTLEGDDLETQIYSALEFNYPDNNIN